MTKEIGAPWLNARRIRAHGLVLAICLWSVYAVDMATPGIRDRNGLIKGTDFLHFYTLGTLALKRDGRLLYDMAAQANVTRQLLPQISGIVYVPLYGPQVSLFFSPLARLSYGWALVVWLLFNTAVYGLCVYVVWKACPNLRAHRWTVLILAIAFPGFFHLLAWGQSSGLALACFTLAFLGLRSERLFLGGLAIGCLAFKPQLGLAAAVIFLLSREWKIVLGAITSALSQVGIGWATYGTPVMRDYRHALLHVREVVPLLEPRPDQMHSLRAFWSLALPWPWAAFVLYIVSALAALGLALRMWKSKLPLSIRYSAVLISTVLVSPHLTVYDLVILAPAFLLLADWSLESVVLPSARAIPLLLYACYPLFLLGPLTRFTHLQLSVPAMAALLWVSNAATLNTP